MRTAFASLFTVVLAAHLAAQQTQPQTRPVFKSRSDLVQVDAVVIDEKGVPIQGLTKTDFVLFDRGTEQVIDAFEEVSHSPIAAPVFPHTLKMDVADNATALSTRLVVIGLDDLHFQGKTQAIKDMARKVVEQIGPSASLALVTTSGSFGVEPTEDRSLLLRELDRFIDRFDPEGRRLAPGMRVQPPGYLPWDSDGGLGFRPSIPADSASFYASMGAFKTIEEVAKRIGADDSRRKAMVWITGGISGPSAVACEDTVKGTGADFSCMASAGVKNMLRRANVVTYAITTGDFPSPVFRDITGSSGGFTINMENFEDDVDRIISDLDHYYLLGFYPSQPEGGGYRELEVRVNIPGARVRARRGYQPGSAPKPPKNRDPLAKLSADVLPKSELSLRLSAAPMPAAKGDKSDVVLTLEVRSYDGPRIEPGKSVPEVLKYSVWAVDLKKKKPVAHVGREAKVTFAPAKVEDDRAREVKYQVHTRLTLPPGRYQFRASASSSQLNRSGSVYFDADVPDFSGAAEPVLGGVMIGHADGARIFNMESPLVKGLVPFEPTLDREFKGDDSLRVFARLSAAAQTSCKSSVAIGKPDGADVRSIDAPMEAGAIDAAVSLKDLLPGSYVVRVGCGAPGAALREVGIVIK
jgi:VWFA-related protein